MKKVLFAALLSLSMMPVFAEGVAAQQELEPQVTIHQDDRGVVEEYRMNGALYMLKVTPKSGISYYLVDADGDGELESRRNELDPDVMIPSWMIFRW